VHSAGPGTLLGGRYALRRRLSQGRDLERWSAHDNTLERDVALVLVDSGHPNGAGVLDAARRAAGVEDTRLVRILDVGSQDGNSFIVEEAMSGSESLAAILLQGPLPAEEARRIAGETARALETASQRGLHHLRLTPQSVLIAPDGEVRVSGVAVAAALDGPFDQEPDPDTASRRDAVCVVAVAYAALAGRWPLDQQDSGIKPAPRVVDGFAAPSEIAAGVPKDLDAICRMTLNEGTGPLTPGEFASQIAPWSRERVRRAGVEPTVVIHVPSADEDTAAAPSHPGAAQQLKVGDKAITAEAITAEAITPEVVATRADESALASVGAAAGVVTGSSRGPAGGASGRTSGRGVDERADPSPINKGMRLPQGRSGLFDDVGPPLPMLPASTAQPPSRGQSKIVVLVMAAFVAIAMFVGFRGLLAPGSGVGLNLSTAKPKVAASPPGVTTPPTSAPSQPVATVAGPIAILSATGFDPQGDQRENNGQAARVYDGDLTTAWNSENYRSAQFGQLKQGVGVLLDLGQPTSVHDITLQLGGGPVDLTVYAATNPALDGATVIGTASAASGNVLLKPAQTMPQAQYVIVWFTSLDRHGGQFRATISEIALT